MKTDEELWYNAYQAWKSAGHPLFKAYWLDIMKHFERKIANVR